MIARGPRALERFASAKPRRRHESMAALLEALGEPSLTPMLALARLSRPD